MTFKTWNYSTMYLMIHNNISHPVWSISHHDYSNVFGVKIEKNSVTCDQTSRTFLGSYVMIKPWETNISWFFLFNKSIYRHPVSVKVLSALSVWCFWKTFHDLLPTWTQTWAFSRLCIGSGTFSLIAGCVCIKACDEESVGVRGHQGFQGIPLWL